MNKIDVNHSNPETEENKKEEGEGEEKEDSSKALALGVEGASSLTRSHASLRQLAPMKAMKQISIRTAV